MKRNAPSSSNPISNLNASFQRWRDKAHAVVDPLKEKIENVASRVVGVTEEAERRHSDCEELSLKLAWVTEQVLKRVSPDEAGDVPTQQVVDELARVASEIEVFLGKRPSMVQDWASVKRAETIARLGKELDEMRLKHVEIRVTTERTGGTGGSQVPANLPLATIPPKPNVFFGRDELVNSIVLRLLQEATCRIPLLGTGGIGKTSVAAAVLNNPEVKAKYGQRRFFLSCEGVPSEEGVIHALAALFGMKPDSNARAAVLDFLAAGGYTLLVLDNLEMAVQSADGSAVEQLLGKIAEVAGLSLIITMRGNFPPGDVEWEDTATLPTLSLDAARQIWARLARKTDDKLDDLLSRLDGLPLAIQLMAHQGKLISPTALLIAYESEATSLMRIGAGGRLM